jgi:signal transduction histidine kinase/CheY-like chemotaxis protein
MNGPIAATPAGTRNDVNQRLRFRRFVLASTFSLLYLVVLAVFHTQDKLDRATLVQASALVAGAIVVFFFLFRAGLNLRFADPSLTGLQFLAAVATMLFVLYRAPDTRLVFAGFFFVALMFGMLRSSGTPLAVLGSVSLACFAAMTGLRYANNGDADVLRLDMLQLLVMATTFPWFVFIGRRVTRLREADRRKNDFLASLAHELRNPLAPIRTGVEIMRMSATEDRMQTVLPMVERQLEQMTRLLDDLLDVSRISRGKIALHLERIDLRRVLDAAVEASRPMIEQMGHALNVSVPATPVFVDADPVRCAQVFSNLLTNAAKYTPSGGRITLQLDDRSEAVEVSIADNGIGIASENLELIFEMFTQVGSAAHAQGGLGIGLSLAKGLVALHGGTIDVHSEGRGRGSVFRVRLPKRSARPALATARTGASAAGRRLKVLVVDDNRDAVASLAMLLELLGHEVRVAYDGDGAVRMAGDFRPELALLDLGMPNVNGYDACRQIRGEPWGTRMTIIAVTGWGQEEDRRRSAAAGFDHHLVKPLSPDTLDALPGLVRAA